MKPAPFDYLRPETLGEAIEMLASSGDDAKLLAGGQSLVPLLALRLASPATLIDLNRVDELFGVTAVGGRVQFGAMTRHRDLITQDEHALTAEAARWIGHAAIRSRGTIGGSLAHADPSAELPAVAVATAARIDVQGPAGTRTIEAEQFFASMLQTTIAEDEILTAIDMGVPSRWGFAEMARREGDFALVLATVAEIDSRWRVVVGGVGSTPWRCEEAEQLLEQGIEPDRAAAAIAAAVADTVDSFEDLHASTAYRNAMAAHVVGQAVAQAIGPKEGS